MKCSFRKSGVVFLALTLFLQSNLASAGSNVRLVESVTGDIGKQFKQVFDKVSQSGIVKLDANNLQQMEQELTRTKEIISQKKVSHPGLIAAIVKSNVSETKRMKKDLFKKIHRMPIEQLDRYGEKLLESEMYFNHYMKFVSAFTRTEKANAIVEAVYSDLDDYLSASIKKVGKLTHAQLARDLTQSEAAFKKTKFGEKKWQRVLLYAGAAVAGVGLATWGIASIAYGSKLRKQRNILQADYDQHVDQLQSEYDANVADFQKRLQEYSDELQGQRDALAQTQKNELNALINQLENQYSALNTELTDIENNFLRENKFTRMVCNQYQAENTTICNNYDYQLFSGNKVCTVMCYKNLQTGKETLHEAPVCTSPYIPADCFSQAKYNQEVDQGYDDGYVDYYPEGDADGRVDGRADGRYNGSIDGYDDGYDTGWYVGYDDIYDTKYSSTYYYNYEDLYDEGFDDAFVDLYSKGYNDAYDDRYWDGYDSTFVDRYNEGYDIGYDAGYSSGYDGSSDSSDDDYYSYSSLKSSKTIETLDDAYQAGLVNGFISGSMNQSLTVVAQ